jgi:hypothetical protein
MSPAEVIGGVAIILIVMVAIVLFGETNTRRHVPDAEEDNVIHEEDIRANPTDG